MDQAIIHFTSVLQNVNPFIIYGVIVVWLSFESAGAPIPNEAVLLFSGYLVGQRHAGLGLSLSQVSFPLVIVSGVLGSFIGASVSFWIGKTGGRLAVRRFGKFVFLSEARVELAEQWYARFGSLAVFICRLIPVVRTVASYPAGFSKMSYRRFAIATVIGTSLWVALFTSLGVVVGKNWATIFRVVSQYTVPVVALLIVLAVAYTVLHYRMAHRAKPEPIASEPVAAGRK